MSMWKNGGAGEVLCRAKLQMIEKWRRRKLQMIEKWRRRKLQMIEKWRRRKGETLKTDATALLYKPKVFLSCFLALKHQPQANSRLRT